MPWSANKKTPYSGFSSLSFSVLLLLLLPRKDVSFYFRVRGALVCYLSSTLTSLLAAIILINISPTRRRPAPSLGQSNGFRSLAFRRPSSFNSSRRQPFRTFLGLVPLAERVGTAALLAPKRTREHHRQRRELNKDETRRASPSFTTLLARGFCVRRVIGYYRLLPRWLYSALSRAELSPLRLLLLLLSLPTVPLSSRCAEPASRERLSPSSSSSSSSPPSSSSFSSFFVRFFLLNRETPRNGMRLRWLKGESRRGSSSDSASNCVCSRV